MEGHIYNVCRGGRGTTIVLGRGMEEYNNVGGALLSHIIRTVRGALLISVENGVSGGDVEIYLEKVEYKKLKGSLVRKISMGLKKEFVDTLGRCTIYDLSNSGQIVWKCVKYFVDDETRGKIFLKKSDEKDLFSL